MEKFIIYKNMIISLKNVKTVEVTDNGMLTGGHVLISYTNEVKKEDLFYDRKQDATDLFSKIGSLLVGENSPKHESVEDWENRNGKKYPPYGPIWEKHENLDIIDWELKIYANCKLGSNNIGKYIHIVATENGRPDEWRP